MEKSRLNSVLKFIVIFVMMLILVYTLSNCVLMLKRDTVDWDNVEMVQLEEPAEGAKIAVISTSLGEMKAVLYPEYAPTAVQNFISLAEKGYYDGTYVFGVQKDTFFLAGAPNKNGELNDDFDNDNENLSNEIHDNLWPLRGAICSINGTGTRSGSRFMVLNSIELTEEMKKKILEASENTMPPFSMNASASIVFLEKGGIPNYSRQYTIFAQVYEGFETLEAICDAEVEATEGTGENDEEASTIPKDDLFINSIVISEYHAD